MQVIILAGGYGTRLWPLTQEIPKCFLEFGGKKILEKIIEKIELVPQVDEIIISTNSKFQNIFESWLSHYKCKNKISFVIENTSCDKEKLGAVKAIDYVIDKKNIDDDILVIAGDNLFEFDLQNFLDDFFRVQSILLAINNVKSFDTKLKLGIVEIDSNKNIVSFEEKPKNPKTTLACTGLYVFPKNKLHYFKDYLAVTKCSDTLGFLFEWLLTKKETIKSWEFGDVWFDIGTEKPYLEALKYYSQRENKIVKVLVTGGAGYLGAILISDLLKEGFYVRVMDNQLYGFALDERVEFFLGDVREKEAVQKALKDIDFVVHLAALSNDPSCEIFLNHAVEINYNGTKTVSTLAKKAGVKRMIFLSSCSVYGALHKDDLITEDNPLAPLTLYAQMKVASEMQIKELIDESFDACILRLATLYGHSPSMRFDLIGNIIPVEAIIDKSIKLFGGSQFRPLLHVKDASNAILLALKYNCAFKGSSFNVGSNSNNFSVRGLTKKIQKELFSDVSIQEYPEKIDDRSYKVSFLKYSELVGFKTDVDLIKGVQEVAENLKANYYGHPRNEQFFRVKYLIKEGQSLLQNKTS